jgi:predicted Rossmann-fold nucleotide-binding protein
VILVGSSYWKGLMDWVGSVLIKEKMISVEDLDIIRTVDEPEEVLHWIQESKVRAGRMAVPPSIPEDTAGY